MLYISFNDLVNDIRNNFYKIRNFEGDSQFCGVLGVPRSGMIPASIIAEMLNVGFASVNEFIEKDFDAFNNHGARLLNKFNTERKKILVIDDTCYYGNSLKRTKNLLQPLSDKYEFVFMCVYLEGPLNTMTPDLFLRDIREVTLKSEIKIALYEWNIMHHSQESCLYDIDGVIFLDPPDERNTEDYIEYIKNPTPLFIPSTEKPLTFCTYRLVKYYDITLNSLLKQGIKSSKMHMFNSDDYFERQKTPSYLFKSYVYSKVEPDKKIFIESDDVQAYLIHENTKKAVFCTTTNKMYS